MGKGPLLGKETTTTTLRSDIFYLLRLYVKAHGRNSCSLRPNKRLRR